MNIKLIIALCTLVGFYSCNTKDSDIKKCISTTFARESSSLEYKFTESNLILSSFNESMSRSRFISFSLKDSLGNHVNYFPAAEHEIVNGEITIPLDLDEQNLPRIKMTIKEFFLWENDVWLVENCERYRYHFIDDGEVLKQEVHDLGNNTVAFNYQEFADKSKIIDESEVFKLLWASLKCD